MTREHPCSGERTHIHHVDEISNSSHANRPVSPSRNSEDKYLSRKKDDSSRGIRLRIGRQKMDNDLKLGLQCPHCGKRLPNDSEFCQFCGKRVEIETSVDNKTKLPDVLLTEIEINEIKGDTPVVVKKVSIFSTADKEDCYLRCVFSSIAQKAISALLLDVTCYDVWGTELAIERSIQILDLSAGRNEEFGSDTKIHLSSKETRFVKLDLKRIRFTDGSIHDCTGEINKLASQKELGDLFDSVDLVQQYIRETSQESIFIPVKYAAIWQCACGELNSDTESVCSKCGVSKQKIFDATDKTFLSEKFTNYRKQQEEQKQAAAIERQRIEDEKREEISQLKNDIIEKRYALAQKEEKQHERRKTWIIVLSVIVLGAIIISLCVCAGRKNAAERAEAAKHALYLRETRNMATDEMEVDFSNVYANVVSIKPKYFIYTYEMHNGVKYPWTEKLSEIVCQCKTVEGKMIWVAINYLDYPEASYSHNEADYKNKYYSEKNPMKLTGEIKSLQGYADGLNSITKDRFILKVKKMEKQN